MSYRNRFYSTNIRLRNLEKARGPETVRPRVCICEILFRRSIQYLTDR